jgi:hypothetical protein
LALVDLAAIGWAVHDIYEATQPPEVPPPVARKGCGGGGFNIENVTAYSIPIVYPGCSGAWNRAQVLAQEICDKRLTCSGTCDDGQRCRPIAILRDRVDETRMIVTCKVEAAYRCECGCLMN